ncbi:hypothetical protein PHSY_006105 [Pseudozyma hubeiensis SY62]|uniref:Uncharacterized protein n=1 Tax=Pseudozyma hubeiensis (strain SY62) TaxID=1305764 RepID=R9PAV8_PSEHS|nr:hypothetical protein PHSY_006105 [Pseudozyma hubeiensis SY62]GAC98511.1 hypothetical protein PHSY_006105 [Pseudozyma hubeiensis SY62]
MITRLLRIATGAAMTEQVFDVHANHRISRLLRHLLSDQSRIARCRLMSTAAAFESGERTPHTAPSHDPVAYIALDIARFRIVLNINSCCTDRNRPQY